MGHIFNFLRNLIQFYIVVVPFTSPPIVLFLFFFSFTSPLFFLSFCFVSIIVLGTDEAKMNKYIHSSQDTPRKTDI